MKILSAYIKNNILEVIFLFFIDLIITIINIGSLCLTCVKAANFDIQTLITWNYSAANNLIPYKDLYFPYGLLPYYRNVNAFFTLLYLGFSVLTFNVIFYIFKKVFKKNSLIYPVSILSLIFLVFISGIESFNRYGISVAFSLVVSYLFFKKILSKKIIFFIGLIISSIFWFIHDQGIYSFFIFSFFFAGQIFLELKTIRKKSDFVFKKAKDLFYFFGGLLIGILPFILYLISNNASNGFWYYLTVSLPEFSFLSKTPFFNFLFTLNNIFSISVLIFSILFVVYKFLLKQKNSMFTFLQIGLIFIILLLEQKNIIRSIENSITFSSFMLFAIVSWELVTLYKKKMDKSVYILILSLVFLIFYFVYGKEVRIVNFSSAFLYSKNSFSLVASELNIDSGYVPIIKKIKSFKDFNNKIFSFPGDPIFYVLLKQRPLFFTSIYEASSKKSQDKIISQITDEKIKYIIINTKNYSIQDEVPNYIRGVYELKFILNNFKIKDVVGDYAILESAKNFDFFTQDKLDLIKSYKNYLLNVNLESIPYSEGLYKSNLVLKNSKYLIKNSKNNLAKEFLKNREIFSENIVLLVKNSSTADKYISIGVKSDNNLNTMIKFKSCSQNYCLINLSNVPLFYKSRIIREISYKDSVSIGILKQSTKNISELW